MQELFEVPLGCKDVSKEQSKSKLHREAADEGNFTRP
jgi:hypothetical protein